MARLKEENNSVFSQKAVTGRDWDWGVCLCWFKESNGVENALGSFHWLKRTGNVPLAEWQWGCSFHWLETQVLGSLAGGTCWCQQQRSRLSTRRIILLALVVSMVTLNVTELWPPDTGPGPGANSIKQIRNLLHRGQKDEGGLRRKGRKTRRKRNARVWHAMMWGMTDRAHVEQLLMTEVLISQVNVQLQGENITLTQNVCLKSRPIKDGSFFFFF